MDNIRSKTILLQYPIERKDGSEIRHVVLRAPRIKDVLFVRDAGGDDEVQGLNMMYCLSGLARDDFEELSMEDTNVLMVEASTLWGKSAATTGES